MDMDGVLVDSRRAILESLAFALTMNGVPAPPTDLSDRLIGPPLRQMMAMVLGEAADEDLVSACMSTYRRHNDEYGHLATVPFIGIESALEAIVSRDSIVVATSKNRASAIRLLGQLRLDGYFVDIDGSTEDSHPEPKTTILGRIIEIHGPIGVMVGDKAQDVLAARAHGIPTLGARWGYALQGELEAAAASAILDSPLELPAAVERIVRSPSDPE